MRVFLSFFLVVVSLGCHHRSDPDPLPDYITNLKFSCQDSNLSAYYGQATINGQPLCYSTSDPLYKNFAYRITSVTSASSTVSNAQAGASGIHVEVGIGGYGDSNSLPAPVFFYIDTPDMVDIGLTRTEIIEQLFQKGATLDIAIAANEKQLLSATANKFKIGMFAQYPVNGNTSVSQFYTWTGVQDTQSAYLKVVDVESVGDAKAITVNFSCKLYDNHGRFFANVSNGRLRFLSKS